MTDDTDSFTARYPDGRLVRLRVKRDTAEPHAESYEKFLKIFTSKADAADAGDDDEIAKARPRDGATGAHGLAAALSEHLIDRLDHLRRKHGFEKKESSPMESIEMLKAERTQKLLAIGKASGAVAMAKILVSDNDSHGIDESEYTRIVTEHAQKLFPDKTPDSAFAKLFSDSGADGVLLRKAHNVVKLSVFDIKPTQVGGDATYDANADERSEATRQLTDMAEKLRATSPWLSADQGVREGVRKSEERFACEQDACPADTASWWRISDAALTGIYEFAVRYLASRAANTAGTRGGYLHSSSRQTERQRLKRPLRLCGDVARAETSPARPFRMMRDMEIILNLQCARTISSSALRILPRLQVRISAVLAAGSGQ